MTRDLFLVGLFISLVTTAPAQAAIPDYVLDKDYQSCMGGETTDTERAAYCNCIRDHMKSWDENSYMSAATQAAGTPATPGGQAAPPQASPDLEALAKECIAQVLK